jgi:threonine/homoserine efflux transporter RhtA
MVTFTSKVCGGLQAQLRNEKYDMPWQRLLILMLAVQPGSSNRASAFPNFQPSSTSQLRVNNALDHSVQA